MAFVQASWSCLGGSSNLDHWYDSVLRVPCLPTSRFQRIDHLLVCLIAALPLANAAGKAQTPWLEAIEKRLAATAKALSAMKAIKMTGLTETVSFKVASLRLSEIRASRRHRVLTTFVMVACMFYEMFEKKQAR